MNLKAREHAIEQALRDEMETTVIPDSDEDPVSVLVSYLMRSAFKKYHQDQLVPPTPPAPNSPGPIGRDWKWPLPLPSQRDFKSKIETPQIHCADIFQVLGLNFLTLPASPWPPHANYRVRLMQT